MPLPENNIILFYWTAPKAVSFLLYGICRLLPLQTYSFGGIIAL